MTASDRETGLTMTARTADDEVTVRDAHADEAAPVAELIHELARTANLESDVTAQQVRAYQRRSDSGILVAALDDRLVGALTWAGGPLFEASAGRSAGRRHTGQARGDQPRGT